MLSRDADSNSACASSPRYAAKSNAVLVCHALTGDQTVTRAILRDTASGDLHEIDCSRVVAALGFTADLGPLTRWGLTIDKRHIVVDTTMYTGVERIFAAGDITEYPGKVRLIATGFGEGATAVNNAAPVIDPAAKVFPGHSSDDGTPAA